jgi:hypothetical protein
MENFYYFFWHTLHLTEAVKCSVAGYTKVSYVVHLCTKIVPMVMLTKHNASALSLKHLHRTRMWNNQDMTGLLSIWKQKVVKTLQSLFKMLVNSSLFRSTCCRVHLKFDGTRWCTGEEVKGKLMNGVGSQYPSHYLGTWCIQHYYCWCAHLDCQ